MTDLVNVEFLTRNGIYCAGDIAAVPRDYADRVVAAGVARVISPKAKKEAP